MSVEAYFHIIKGDFTLDVELAISEQGVTAIMGPSGCGKTTLLRTIAGLERCAKGYLKVGEATWQDDKRFVPTHKRSLGYVFQEASLFVHLNVKGNLQYGLNRIAGRNKKFSLERAINLLGIDHLLDRQVEQLSGGEKQRVAIARALALSPEILLMDEPLTGLDTARKQEIMPYLESVHAELQIPMLYVSHSIDEVVQIADQIVLIENGKIRTGGGITDMLTQLDISLTGERDAGVYLDTIVASHDDLYGLCNLEFPGGTLSIASDRFTVGQSVRLRVAARDVSLTLARQKGTSILNIFPAIIDEISGTQGPQLTVRVNVNGVSILSRITRKSATLLGLEVGKPVYAQLKSAALA